MPNESKDGRQDRQPGQPDESWEPMTLTYVGDAGELLETGGGKMSPAPDDPGEIFKTPGLG